MAKIELAKSIRKIQIMNGIIIALIAVVYFLHYNREEPMRYAYAPDNSIFTLSPLNEPNVSTDALLSWASLAVTSTYTIDFVNYEDNFEIISKYFTDSGFASWKQAFIASNGLDDILSKKLIVTAVRRGNPVILQEGPENGFYTWRIQIPVLVTYQGAAQTSTSKRKVATILVTRVPTTVARNGIGIAQFND